MVQEVGEVGEVEDMYHEVLGKNDRTPNKVIALILPVTTNDVR